MDRSNPVVTQVALVKRNGSQNQSRGHDSGEGVCRADRELTGRREMIGPLNALGTGSKLPQDTFN